VKYHGFTGNECAGLSQSLYKMLDKGDDPFYCPHCRLSVQENHLHELKSSINKLIEEVTALKVTTSITNQILIFHCY